MKKQRLLVLSLIIFFFNNITMALELPEPQVVPGGIAVIKIGSSENQTKPQTRFNNKPVMLVQHNSAWYAIIGIPLKTPLGQQILEVKTHHTQRSIPFIVKNKEYEAQYITIKNKRKVNPEQRDLKRIHTESARMRKAFNHFDESIPLNKLQFSLPVEGTISSHFGLRRFFNKQPRKPHSGLDIAADTGTEIQAPLAGRIIETGNFFFNGNTVMIDHGQGLISMYCHLNKSLVKKGQAIQEGEVIGTVGMTGRVTGPHLHWSISLNNARIDPLLLLPPPQIP
ncbi:MAG: M23 family metallopeptidase [Gammaproteobacteria bacterium]|nr:M23 family metallopeptidase [Gammaproteobacteria bacterium]